MSYQKRRSGRGRNYNHGSQNRQTSSRKPKKENIHPSKFVKRATAQEEVIYEPKHSFEDFAVHATIGHNLRKHGYNVPSPIQDQIIPFGLDGKNVIGIANTGTGKTMAFAIPLLNRLLSDNNAKALVIAPTRELAMQIFDECKKLTEGTQLRTATLIGGVNIRPQLGSLSRNPSLVIGTPGRIMDHMRQNSLHLHRFNMVVLDEVDRMLDMGFVRDMRTILRELPVNKQTFFFSATLDDKARELADEFTTNPILVSVKTGDTTDSVEQDVVYYRSPEDKAKKLESFLRDSGSMKVLIFDDTRRQTDKLSKQLKQDGFQADSIHGGKSQGQRKRALASFKNHETNILVATDVAARGIDISGITHVVNYSTPQTYADYCHRIGRAGRAGKQGAALTFLPASH